MVEFAEPMLTREAAIPIYTERLRRFCEEMKIRDPKNFNSKNPLRRHFDAAWLASPEYLGPLTGAVVAGYFKRHLKIKTKSAKRGLVPFVVNEVQFDFLDKICWDWEQQKPVRAIVLKARQFGISTAIQGLFFFLMLRHRHLSGCTVAHKSDATGNVHEMWRTFYSNMTHEPFLKKSNRQEVAFVPPFSCRMGLDTAENEEVKRSFTHQLIHASEVAFWPRAERTRLGLMQTIHELPETIAIEESTANGMGGEFYNLYWNAVKGKNDYSPMFYPWFRHDEYRLELTPGKARDVMRETDKEEKEGIERWGWTPEQIAWRRKTLADRCNGDVSKFHQEYPSTDREAFLVSGSAVFDQSLIERRRELLNDQRLHFRGDVIYTGAV